ncbi:hypothetical protein D9Q98_002759 [Chlorella vulgaris]|uniref:Myb-like domain-containing protein n=1 Tax=Chlorella vulgaris TaxID=3077 RepID=A0A9D4TU27_CHLVU|nr:hypothetical protein D9Q98_002759 [Chlorella vulgaris]
MTQAAAAAANGAAAAAPGSSVAVKTETSPAPDGKGAAAGAAAPGGSRGSTPGVAAAAAADGRRGSKSASPPAAAGASKSAQGTPEAGAAAGAPPSQEDEEQRRLEDEILAEGQAIAGVRALLARAFSRPAEEPALPTSHWGFLLQEAEWLSNDMAQERLWKQAAAMAVAYEVAALKGKFGLKPPPEGQRRYHDEILAARTALVKEAAEKTGGRRAASKAAADSNGAAALKLDPADDPVFRELEGFEELSVAALAGDTPRVTGPSAALSSLSLVFQHDEEFQEVLEEHLRQTDIQRIMQEEMAAREYRFEYDAALASHHMALQEQNRRAMRLDADMTDAEGLMPMDEDGGEEEDYAGKKAKNRKRQRSGGYLLDDFATVGAAGGAGAAEDTESMGTAAPKQKAASRQYIEDTYLQRKRRRERYKDVDVDYDVGQEAAGRYGTRATRALATRAGASRAQDPRRKQQVAGARPEGLLAAPGGGGAMGARGGVRLAPGAVPGPVIWSKGEDDLLLAITHEFGVNWTMVSEVLSLSLSMQGIFRPPHLCKQRFRQITTPLLQQQQAASMPAGTEVAVVDYSEDKALMALYLVMSKQQARELIVTSLPVHDDVMMRMLEALVQVGATHKQRRMQEEKRNEANKKMQDPHPSHLAVRQAIMAKTGNKHLTPMELAVQVDVAYAHQAKQHQAAQLQAQQAQQLQAQQAAAPPPQGPQGGAGNGGGGAGGMSPGPGNGGPAQGMPAAGVAAGTPAGPPGLSAQQQQQGMPGSATPPLPPGAGPGGLAAGQQQAQQQGMAQQQAPGAPGGGSGQMQMAAPPAGTAPVQRPAAPQITLAQLNHILDTGKLPNGQPLQAPMRKAIEEKRNTYLASMQQQQQQQRQMQQMQMAAAGGGGPGGAGQPSAATQAALQAAQAAAAVQANMRPAMGMHGMYRPAMGQPGGMPAGAAGMSGQQGIMLQQQMAQMAAGGNPGMQQLQGGMQLPHAAAQQQQLIAQQFALQQQQAAAAQQQQAAAAAAQHGGGPPQGS